MVGRATSAADADSHNAPNSPKKQCFGKVREKDYNMLTQEKCALAKRVDMLLSAFQPRSLHC